MESWFSANYIKNVPSDYNQITRERFLSIIGKGIGFNYLFPFLFDTKVATELFTTLLIVPK